MGSPIKNPGSLEENAFNLSFIAREHLPNKPIGNDDRQVVDDFLKIPHINNVIRPGLMVIANLSHPLPFLYEKNFNLDFGTEENSYESMVPYISPETIRRSDIIDRKIVEFAYKHRLNPYDFVYRFYFDLECPNPELRRLCRTVFFIAAAGEGQCSHCVVNLNDVTGHISKFQFPGYEISFAPDKKHLEGKLKQFIAEAIPRHHNLTERECEVITMLNQGLSSKMIAHELGISKHTVDTYRRKLLKKLGACNTADLLNKASEVGII